MLGFTGHVGIHWVCRNRRDMLGLKAYAGIQGYVNIGAAFCVRRAEEGIDGVGWDRRDMLGIKAYVGT